MLVPGSLCPNVRHINITYIDWAAQVTPHGDVFTYLSSYTAVQHLRLARCRFKDIKQLYRLVNSLPSLESLRLDRVRHASEAGSDLLTGLIGSSLDSLRARISEAQATPQET